MDTTEVEQAFYDVLWNGPIKDLKVIWAHIQERGMVRKPFNNWLRSFAVDEKRFNKILNHPDENCLCKDVPHGP